MRAFVTTRELISQQPTEIDILYAFLSPLRHFFFFRIKNEENFPFGSWGEIMEEEEPERKKEKKGKTRARARGS